MDEDDLKKIVEKDSQVRIAVMDLVGKKNNMIASKVVEDALKNITQKFRELIMNDERAAMVVTNVLEHDDFENISKDDSELGEALMRARKKCGDKLWEINDHDDDDDSDVREMLRPLQNITENEHFKDMLSEELKLGVTVINTMIKGSKGLKKEMTKSYKEDGCYCFVVLFCHYHRRYEMSKAAKQLAKDTMFLIEKTPKPPVTLQRDLKPIPSRLFRGGLASRDKLLQKILKKLQDDQVNEVALYGMGGSGKTTLAKEVEINKRVKCNFKEVVMCEVSETPNIKNIQDQIAEKLGLDLHDVHSFPQRAIKLYNRLKQGKQEGKEMGKKEAKTLIILDNIWQKLNLEEIGIPCKSTNDSCCKFLFTSREKNICHMMGVRDDDISQMELVDDTDSMKLFCLNIEKDFLEGGYKSMAQKLLKKCGGLPLTIVATANALKGKELSVWRQFADKLEKPISTQVSGIHSETYTIIETSYNVIGSEEKKMFFLLSCLFPLGISMSIENMMRYGIGLDLFQHVNKLSEAIEQASTWASELIASSMLLEGDSQGHVKMHDVIRASTFFLAAKGKRKFLVEAIPEWMCKETFNKYMAISLSSSHSFSRLSGVKARMLQILLLRGDSLSNTKLEGCFFQGMENLRVLHLSYMNLESQLPASIGKLTKLKTLHLEECKLQDIGLICELKELLVLSLRNSAIVDLPAEMGKLCNLRILDMSGCKLKLEPFPSYINTIVNLSSLEGLYLFDNFDEWAFQQIEFNYFREFTKRSILELSDHELMPRLNLLQVFVTRVKDLPVGIFDKKLDMFKIVVKDRFNMTDFRQEHGTFNRFFVLDDLDPRRGRNYGLNNNIYLKAFPKRPDGLILESLCIKWNDIVTQLGIEVFRDLKHLNISRDTSMECIISTDGRNDFIAFPNLEYLELSHLDKLKMICKGEVPPGMFNKLRHLVLIKLHKLQYALPVAQYRSLTEIRIKTCQQMKFLFKKNDRAPAEGEPEQYNEQDVAINLPCLKSMVLTYLKNLVNFLEPTNESTSNPDHQAFFNGKIMCSFLEKLDIASCDSIISLWSKEIFVSSFQNLKEIIIKGCHGLETLGPLCTVLKLERLEIRQCNSVQYVITNETQEHNNLKFPQLRILELEELPNLKSFYGGCYKVEFPELRKLTLCRLHELTTILVSEVLTTLFCDKVEFPSLEELEVVNVFKDTHTQLSAAIKDAPELRKLKKLTLDDIKWLKLFPSTTFLNLSSLQLQSYTSNITTRFIFSTADERLECFDPCQLRILENLGVHGFEELENMFESKEYDTTNDTMSRFYGQLKYLELKHLPKLKIVPFCLFTNLRTLYIDSLKWEYVFPSYLVLEKLEYLRIYGNSSEMNVVADDEQKGGGSDRSISFPSLKILDLNGICSLSSRPDAPMDFPSLETLILGCCSLKEFCSGPLVAPKLKDLEIDRCFDMKSFISGNESKQLEFPSLQRVTLKSVSGMESFSTRPLKVPMLKEVELVDCNKLRMFTAEPLEAPKLTQVTGNKVYSRQEFENLNDLVSDEYSKYYSWMGTW